MQAITLSTKHYASLAAIMLLAPVVLLSLKSNDIELTADEQVYIAAFVKYGNYVLGIALLSGLFWGFSAFVNKNSFMNSTSTRLSALCIIMIFIGMYAIVKNTTVQQIISSIHLPWKK